MNRRAFFRGLTGAALAFCAVSAAEVPAQRRPRVGAIRWDAWYDPHDGKIARYVERTLGPAEFHPRMPFFGRETGPASVRINGDTQQVMDAEIGLAATAGLAYWAFCAYAEDDPMSNALHLYLSSAHRREIGFCLITGVMSLLPYFAAQSDVLLRLLLEPGYATVLGNRPLFYLLSPSDPAIARSGGVAKMAGWIQYLRAGVRQAGKGDPYFVLSEGDPARAVKLCHQLGLDAVGLYASALGPFGAAPYQVLVQQTEREWDKLAASGLPLVPNIMTGWDTRPRLRLPTPWDWKPGQKPPSPTHYYQQGTPEEIARHAADALRWMSAHPAAAPAGTALIYAWDECDEGFGALIPSYRPGQPRGDNSRLRALAPVLRGA